MPIINNSKNISHLLVSWNLKISDQSRILQHNSGQIMITCLLSDRSVPPSLPRVHVLLITCLTLMTAQGVCYTLSYRSPCPSSSFCPHREVRKPPATANMLAWVTTHETVSSSLCVCVCFLMFSGLITLPSQQILVWPLYKCWSQSSRGDRGLAVWLKVSFSVLLLVT